MARPAGIPQPRAQEPIAHAGGRVKLYAYISREHYEKARTSAYSDGMSFGAYLSHLIEADEVDEVGRSRWASAQAELPLTA